MRFINAKMASCCKMAVVLLIAALVSAEESASRVKFESSSSSNTSNVFKFLNNGTSDSVSAAASGPDVEGRRLRNDKSLFDFIGFGTGADTDPYLAKVNSMCLNGELAECFKSQALSSLEEFFNKETYPLGENARVVKMPATQLRTLHQEPFEFAGSARADDSEWDQFLKFSLRKIERFLKSNAIEVQFPDEITDYGRYSPRFIDEIASEVDILEDKTDSKKSRYRLKKLLIPMLIILKLFKLKLLLFLPLILGLASFKKLLGFLAIAIPGIIGFFRLCNGAGLGSYGGTNYYNTPLHQYSPGGVGLHGGNYYASGFNGPAKTHSNYYNGYGRDADAKPSTNHGSVAFRDPDSPPSDAYDAQQLAYQGYKQY